MNELVPAEAFSPGEILQDELDARKWTQTEFAEIIGRSPKFVNEIIKGEKSISARTAREIAAALGTSPMFWLNLESAYRLHHSQDPIPERIGHQARIRQRFPIHEMVKRRWIESSSDPSVLEAHVLRFFAIKDIEDTPRLAHAAKRTGYPSDLSGPQLAWLFRVKQLAEAMHGVRAYSERLLRDALSGLEAMRIAPEAIGEVPRLLADCGVRFVIVEPVPASKIDGVCFWLGGSSPVIGMSLRQDRIDNFWFVLRHEIEHVLSKHGREEAIVDEALGVPGEQGSQSEEERIANAAAAEFCVPQADMADFVSRHRPIFTAEAVRNFASRMRVHPGLVVGQLQWRTERWDLFRARLVKIREHIVPVAYADGYGHIISLES